MPINLPSLHLWWLYVTIITKTDPVLCGTWGKHIPIIARKDPMFIRNDILLSIERALRAHGKSEEEIKAVREEAESQAPLLPFMDLRDLLRRAPSRPHISAFLTDSDA
ncbi:MAG: hypothetical protein AB1690_02480 [Candidatus Zixiibacteriota bacterium]